jgi:cytochrome c553
MKKIILLVAVSSIYLWSCKDESSDPTPVDNTPVLSHCDSVAATYEGSIMSIINTSCATEYCHSANAKANGLDLSTYAGVKMASGYPAFIGAITHDSSFTAMPYNLPKLSDKMIDEIECWISSGTPEK